MNWLNKIKRWPIEKKRIFSISLAIFLTVLIIILNSGINLIWKDETKNIQPYNKNNSIHTIQESFTEIFDTAKPTLDQIFGSSTNNLSAQTSEIIDQTNSTSSSFSTTSNVVQ